MTMYKRVTKAKGTIKTAGTHKGMPKRLGNAGNTKGTTLPKDGCPAHRKKGMSY